MILWVTVDRCQSMIAQSKSIAKVLKMDDVTKTMSDADRNWRRFVWFRVLFNARFYYPVLAVLFLDLGLSATEYTLLHFAWALAIVAVDVPAGVLADRVGRRPLVVGAAVSMVVEMVLLCAAPRH